METVNNQVVRRTHLCALLANLPPRVIEPLRGQFGTYRDSHCDPTTSCAVLQQRLGGLSFLLHVGQ